MTRRGETLLISEISSGKSRVTQKNPKCVKCMRRNYACEMIKCVKKDIQVKAEKGEFNLIGGKHYVSSERFQLYCYYGWDITDMHLSTSVMELGEEWHDRLVGFTHIFVETLKEASWFTPCKKRIYITKQEVFFAKL